MALEIVSVIKVYNGTITKYKFKSAALGGLMSQFNLFVPANASSTNKVPVLIYMAGLGCDEDNGAKKGGFIGPAAKEGIALLFPDTSPRGAGVEGEEDHWDFGVGAGYYLDATKPPYTTHYNMFTHVTEELPQVIGSDELSIPVDWTRQSLFGHCTGGHGALSIYLTYLLGLGDSTQPRKYRSASAFAPVSNPSLSPWGIKAFNGFLQGGVEEGKAKYDVTELVAKCEAKENPVHVLVDYGSNDKYLKAGELLPENFLKKAREVGYDEVQVRVRKHEGYGHNYYFVHTFAEDHVHFHANFLKA